ncbi:ParB/RepB/Spo0J family partition protein [Burkholderia glumae]|uniref:ParB N-terminal domain-containing protein n=2 Tax=Burkholderia glumae TaxID=337 RepID=A0AAP9Y604_BURGL|nr:ParB N-terminal domain-containing protein [Burkholderia glumae]ACR32681.1 partition protein parB [Burkholderia glumae BGR1]AJY62354.1 parB-like nuclease domain protein [Burkholderia glumae LMG 2196 = ATCC 33617]PNK93253.1 chromosome partitioning protein ParB [Burkholderia glumae]QGA41708.1 chromosome partitioning protein ParB [Burkholderia glumae]QPQ94715.1 ParB N-terminal domain-containing protein [Burkholderia glumae]
MTIKDRLAAKSQNIGTTVRAPRADADTPVRPKTAPGQLMASMPLLAEKERELQAALSRAEAAEREGSPHQQEEIERLRRELIAAKSTGTAIDIPVSELHEVAGRRRFMPREKYVELRENLRHNPLVQPIIVLPRNEGGFEIQSGHHRWDAYKELGRRSVKCVLGDPTGSDSDIGAFNANLMQSDLTDYEKYKGLKLILSRYPEMSQAQLVERTGIPKASVSRLMSFGELPPTAIARLEELPSLMGATAGGKFAALVREGKEAAVVEAIELLATNKIDETQAVKLASRSTKQGKSEAVPKAETHKFKIGKSVYCDMRMTGKLVRLEFQSEDEARAVQAAIKEVVEARRQEKCGESGVVKK